MTQILTNIFFGGKILGSLNHGGQKGPLQKADWALFQFNDSFGNNLLFENTRLGEHKIAVGTEVSSLGQNLYFQI
jgi:hypothetical protein